MQKRPLQLLHLTYIENHTSMINKSLFSPHSVEISCSITQILCDISFQVFRTAKSTILTHLEALNFDFYKNFTLRLKSTKSTIFRAPKMAKMVDLEVLNSPKLISHNI